MPRVNAVAERAVRTFRNEYLDHPIPIDERNSRSVFWAFADYSSAERPHRGLEFEAPQAAARPATDCNRSRAVPGGPHHVHERAA